ncbi:PEP-CTERM sorting domain-containing protein [Opitutaceae bacterium TAV3]|nr:PEP-CTERM sorting domain-containing protein [Opitutaceae bacterium TAV3]
MPPSPPPPGVPEPASAAMILGLVALAGLLARKCWKNSRR